MTNRPNRGWRIHGNTAGAVIQRPPEITMTLEQDKEGKRHLALQARPVAGDTAEPPTASTNYEFAPGRAGPAPSPSWPPL